MKFTAATAVLAMAAILAIPAWAQEDGPILPPGNGEKPPEEGLKPAGGDVKPAEGGKPENGEGLRERKRRFMEDFNRRLSDVRKDETTPERKEIARLEDLKREYQGKLRTSEEELDRSKQVVLKSFTELVDRNKDPEDLETRCETIWLDYMRQSRDKKTAIFEYQSALKGVDRRINFIRKREVERDLPGLNYQKYYTVDDLEVYGEDEGLDFNVFGEQKSHVSYYAMLKEFVLEMSGRGRGDNSVIEKWIEVPPLVQRFRKWQESAPKESGPAR